MVGFEEALDRAEALLERGGRVVLGIAGAPAAGKTTLAQRLVAAVEAEGRWRAAQVPMDGYHLADVSLDRIGRRDRKGAVDTFDGWGYRALLRRLAARADEPVYAPGFERTLEQPIAGSIEIGPEVDLIVTEGNYLLVDEEPWRGARSLCTEVWFCAAPPDVRLDRLIARHIEFGKAPDAARAWVEAVDVPNAALIEATRSRADLEVDAAR